MNGEGIIIRSLVALIEIITIVSAILMLSQFKKNKELIKARLFLLYDKLNRMMIIVMVLAVIGMLCHTVYMVILGNDPAFLSAGEYLHVGWISTAVALALIFVFLTVYFMLKPVGK